jgi:hypothetical protein
MQRFSDTAERTLPAPHENAASGSTETPAQPTLSTPDAGNSATATSGVIPGLEDLGAGTNGGSGQAGGVAADANGSGNAAAVDQGTETLLRNTTEGAINPQLYARQNPRSKFDPEGLDEFSIGTMEHMNSVGIHLGLSSSNVVGRQAALNFVGEENDSNQRKGIGMMLVHQFHNKLASSGLDGFDPRSVSTPGGGPIPPPMFPESMVRGNIFKKGLTQADPLLHDIGPANIKLKTAADVMGATTTWGLGQVAKSLVTDAGTALVTTRLVENAQKDLNPLISARPAQEQVQILTGYLRAGPEKYWADAGAARGMSPEQVEEWRKNPDGFQMPDGSKPKPLTNNQINNAHMKQIERVERKTRPADQ